MSHNELIGFWTEQKKNFWKIHKITTTTKFKQLFKKYKFINDIKNGSRYFYYFIVYLMLVGLEQTDGQTYGRTEGQTFIINQQTH